jgi:hypothetical protein
MSRLIDYSNERLCFVDLEEKEVQRQERTGNCTMLR